MSGGGGGPIPIYSNYLNIYRFKQFEFFKRGSNCCSNHHSCCLITCIYNSFYIDKVKIVLKILKEMQEDKEKQDILVQEKFILSRIIYKLNAQLRSEKTLQCLKRVSQS